MLTSGGTPLQLTHGEHRRTRPAWSPDGSEIAYILDRGEESSFEIMAVPALGGPPRAITRSTAIRGLDWSPDGDDEWPDLWDDDEFEDDEEE